MDGEACERVRTDSYGVARVHILVIRKIATELFGSREDLGVGGQAETRKGQGQGTRGAVNGGNNFASRVVIVSRRDQLLQLQTRTMLSVSNESHNISLLDFTFLK